MFSPPLKRALCVPLMPTSAIRGVEARRVFARALKVGEGSKFHSNLFKASKILMGLARGKAPEPPDR